MPLYPNAHDLLALQFESLARRERVGLIVIGKLTETQHKAINALKKAQGLDGLDNPELVYLGKHHYNSRVVGDGYGFEDLFKQLQSSLDASSVPEVDERVTRLRNPHTRADGYGCHVNDVAVLELNSRKPRAEVYSAIPKGDNGGPKRKKAP